MTTRLFPDLKFGCFGTIVEVTAAVEDNDQVQDPKVQIWRENKTQPGLYHNIASDLPLNRSQSAPCYQNTYDSAGTGFFKFQCVLNEDHRMSVQPGDFLGLEIPPLKDNICKVIMHRSTIITLCQNYAHADSLHYSRGASLM